MRASPIDLRLAISISLLLALLIALSGCAGSARKGSGLPERIELESYSFQSPVEPRWLLVEQSGDAVVLAMQGRVEGESFLIEGRRNALEAVSDAERLVRVVRDAQARNLPQPRFRIYQHDVSAIELDGATCALSHIVTEDRDPGTGTNVVSSMLVESVGTLCVQPSDPASAVSLNYTHRSFPEDRDRGFAAAATQLMQTQRFNPPGTQQ